MDDEVMGIAVGEWDNGAACQQVELLTRGWPEALIKSVIDPFTYALCLKGGMVIVYDSAIPSANQEWVHLTNPEMRQPGGEVVATGFTFCGEPFNFDRGVDVRVAEIVWVCDAPWGS